ncbi:DNA-binding response regulator [Kibdelosporangium aridum]|uniref:DNA-binding response regulator n=2 Tax=Kibdelosporangium aridum TaxID=2030 RepID=A0A428ZCQ0_KIBAR|nr:DNA-binding response regulator [Kibdelosporangium aridum]
MVVDDDALVRSGFELILRAAGDIDVVATATGAQAVGEIQARKPDVVLLDIRMPDVDGLTILRQVRAMSDPPVVAMLTTFDSDEYIAAALRSGAAGFLLKDTDPEQLAQLVRTLASGGVVLSPKVTRSVVDGYLDAGASSEAADRVARLTDRERDVLVLIAEGLSNADIGARSARSDCPAASALCVLPDGAAVVVLVAGHGRHVDRSLHRRQEHP